MRSSANRADVAGRRGAMMQLHRPPGLWPSMCTFPVRRLGGHAARTSPCSRNQPRSQEQCGSWRVWSVACRTIICSILHHNPSTERNEATPEIDTEKIGTRSSKKKKVFVSIKYSPPSPSRAPHACITDPGQAGPCAAHELVMPHHVPHDSVAFIHVGVLHQALASYSPLLGPASPLERLDLVHRGVEGGSHGSPQGRRP